MASRCRNARRRALQRSHGEPVAARYDVRIDPLLVLERGQKK